MPLCSRPRRITLVFGVIVAFVVGPACAAETGNGSKNFNVPTSVPNYFSNEAGPLQGPASEMRRGPLYSAGTAAEVPQASARTVAVVIPHSRQHIVMVVPRGRLVRGRVAYDRRGHALASYHAAAHGRPVSRVVARTAGRGHVAHVAASRGRFEHIAARPHTVVHRPTQVSSAHRHGRG